MAAGRGAAGATTTGPGAAGNARTGAGAGPGAILFFDHSQLQT
jgi:hypothetical protein